ncbi:hypothetical protein LCGC14_3135510 [marine sediment metagenome]|uniref:Uncharacterized protein n=1 Tax=marine sediment metagenome TaxID=412755 RepID=A0A0F8WMD9_9ZZZZ
MPDAAALALSRWLDLPCAGCEKPYSSEHGSTRHDTADGRPAQYQPPDPEDGRTMIAVLDALAAKRYSVIINLSPDPEQPALCCVEDPRLRESGDVFGSEVGHGQAPTLPGAVWAAAGAVEAEA